MVSKSNESIKTWQPEQSALSSPSQTLDNEFVLDQIIRQERKKIVKKFTQIAQNYDKIIEQFPEDRYHTTFLSLSHKETKSGQYDTQKLLKMYLGLTKILPEEDAHDLILKYTDNNHTTKTHQSIKAKFERRRNVDEIKDFFRTTITREDDFQDTQDLFNEFEKTAQILDHFGYTVHEFKPKLKPGGYSDLSVIFENNKSDKDKTYFEVQYNNKKCLDIKNIETKYYNIKRDISAYFNGNKKFSICLELYYRKQIYNDFDSPIDFGISIKDYKIFLIAFNKIISDYNPDLQNNLLKLKEYEEAFVAGFELYQLTNPVIKNVVSVKLMENHYQEYLEEKINQKIIADNLEYQSKLNKLVKKMNTKL
jgi:hypothetical protein